MNTTMLVTNNSGVWKTFNDTVWIPMDTEIVLHSSVFVEIQCMKFFIQPNYKYLISDHLKEFLKQKDADE